jgi:thiamine-monophosphate kinase
MLEAKLINLIKSLTPDPSIIGDDCAVIDIAGTKYLFSVDNFVEKVHFLQDYFSPEDIGWKALAVNISDIAAMAGTPLWILVGLSLSKQITDKEQWVKGFYTGLNECAEKFGKPKVIGGDITASETDTFISISIIGQASQPLLRSTAQPGDKVCATGKFGNSAKFLESKKNAPRNDEIAHHDELAHLRPQPRLKEAQEIFLNNERGALMDTSDGLAQALYAIAEASQVDIELDLDLIPRDNNIDLSLALYGGEDYELLGCFEQIPLNFTQIGLVKAPKNQPTVYILRNNAVLSKNEIYNHF